MLAKDSSDHQHKELRPQEIFNLFKEKFEDITTPFNISEVHFKQHNGIIAEVTVECEGKSVVAIAAGNGRLNAVSNALKNQFRLEYDLTTYQEHALEQSSSSKAIAYVGIRKERRRTLLGCRRGSGYHPCFHQCTADCNQQHGKCEMRFVTEHFCNKDMARPVIYMDCRSCL